MRMFILFAFIFTQSTFAQTSLCEKYFSKEYVENIALFKKKFTSSSEGGTSFGPHTTMEVSYSASDVYRNINNIAELKLNVSNTTIPIDKWKKTRLLVNDESLDLIKAGERMHAADIESLDNLVLENFKGEYDSINIKYAGKKLEAILESRRETKLIHEKVIDLYSARKGHYLKKEDLEELRSIDTAYPDQNVYALTKPSSKRIIDITDDEFKEGIEATLSVVYSKRSMYAPSFAHNGEIKNTFYLPLYQRIHTLDPKSHARAEKRLYEFLLDDIRLKKTNGVQVDKSLEDYYREMLDEIDLDPQVGFNYASSNINTYEKLTKTIEESFGKEATFAEFIRFAKFSNVSDEMFSKLILNAFQDVKNSGTDVILISADRITQRHFRQNYGFQTLGEIETKRINQLTGDEKLEKEFVMYIKVDGAEFKEVVKKLSNKTKNISKKLFPL